MCNSAKSVFEQIPRIEILSAGTALRLFYIVSADEMSSANDGKRLPVEPPGGVSTAAVGWVPRLYL
jgi:hypothetical protein